MSLLILMYLMSAMSAAGIVTFSVSSTVFMIAMMIFSVIMSMSINVRMSFIFLALIPVLAIALFGIFFYVHPIFKRIFKKYDALNNSVQENVGGIRVVKSFVREDYEKEKFGKAA